MKNIIIVIIICFISSYATFGSKIDKKTALTVAQNFMNERQPDRVTTISEVLVEKENDIIVYYIISFKKGGWVMVSADNSTIPVIGYSYDGFIDTNIPKPDAFVEWTNNYKMQILRAKEEKIKSKEAKEKWNRLINSRSSKLKDLQYTYTPSTNLLATNRGTVIWAQDENRNGGCSPSFNKFAPSSDDSDCDCDHKPIGCGAVAMGQIMWYWQWPNTSSYRSYDWEMMPDTLLNSTEPEEGDEIAHLLHDCAESANMNYGCNGSWTTTNNLEDGFKDRFKYKGVEKKVRTSWDYGNAWHDMIRAEIDAGRPVLYRGDKSDLSTAKHFFVCSGYSASSIDEFYFNWGWNGSYNGFYHIDDLTPGSHDYNKNQMAIIGISPTCSQAPANLNDVSYTTLTTTKHEQARQNITLPASGKTLTVNNGGKLILTAGNTVRLNPGFSATNGSTLKVNFRQVSFGDMGINVPSWYNAFTPNGDGINDELCFDVYNADTWEFEAFDRWGLLTFQSAGTVNNDLACVWDGTGSCSLCAYACIIKFRNSCGEVLDNAYTVTVIGGSAKSASADTIETNKNTIYNFRQKENIPVLFEQNHIHVEEIVSSIKLNIYPNPNKGIFSLSLEDNFEPYTLCIYDIVGQEIYHREELSSIEHRINIENKSKGVYLLKVIINNKTITKRIIIQ